MFYFRQYNGIQLIYHINKIYLKLNMYYFYQWIQLIDKYLISPIRDPETIGARTIIKHDVSSMIRLKGYKMRKIQLFFVLNDKVKTLELQEAQMSKCQNAQTARSTKNMKLSTIFDGFRGLNNLSYLILRTPFNRNMN